MAPVFCIEYTRRATHDGPETSHAIRDEESIEWVTPTGWDVARTIEAFERRFDGATVVACVPRDGAGATGHG